MTETIDRRTGEVTRTVERKASDTPMLDTVLVETSKRAQSIAGEAASFLGVPPAKVCDLLRHVWKVSKDQEPLTDQEMFAGMSMIARFQLDPIAREVYVTRTKQGLATIIGIDGWIKILDRTEGYDGFEQEVHCEGDEVAWVETRIYTRKRTRPTTYRALAWEYASLAGFMHTKIPVHMLRLFSLRHAARLFTPIGCTAATEEEARWMNVYDPEIAKATAPGRIVPPKKSDPKKSDPKPAEQEEPKQEQPAPEPPVDHHAAIEHGTEAEEAREERPQDVQQPPADVVDEALGQDWPSVTAVLIDAGEKVGYKRSEMGQGIARHVALHLSLKGKEEQVTMAQKRALWNAILSKRFITSSGGITPAN